MARLTAPIVPTARAAVALALAAPLAIVVAAVEPDAWTVAPALGIALSLLVLVDALLAGRIEHFEIDGPDDAEVGVEGRMTAIARFSGGHQGRVEAALACDPRLAPGGRLFALLDRVLAEGEPGRWQATVPFTPKRRGHGDVGPAWLRWTGPLGLGARQGRRDIEGGVRVWPDLGTVRGAPLQAFLRDSQTGILARRIRGEGTQFEALADYQPGMDRRRIDWKASARHVHLYAKEYENERNNQIVFAFDCGQAMCEPVGGVPRLDRAVSAALAAAYVALKGGDRVALFGFAQRPEVSTPFVASARDFRQLQQAAASLEYRPEEPNFTLALATLASRLQRRSLVVVFSDFTDLAGAEIMMESIARLVTRHVVLFVTMEDEELVEVTRAEPDDMETLTMAVAADQLLRQRALVTRRLRQLGVDVVEAPWNRIGPRLIDAYLAIKRAGAIG